MIFDKKMLKRNVIRITYFDLIGVNFSNLLNINLPMDINSYENYKIY